MPRVENPGQYKRRDAEEWAQCPNPDCPYEVKPSDEACKGCDSEEHGGPVWVQQRQPLGWAVKVDLQSMVYDEEDGGIRLSRSMQELLDRTVADASISRDVTDWLDDRFGYYAMEWLGLLDAVDQVPDEMEDVEERKKKFGPSSNPTP